MTSILFMKKLIVGISLIMLFLCGCYRNVDSPEFMPVILGSLPEKDVSTVTYPLVYKHEDISGTGICMNVVSEIDEVENLSCRTIEFDMPLPQNALISDYCIYGDWVYYSYSYRDYIYGELEYWYEKTEEELNRQYASKLMRYNYVTGEIIEIGSYTFSESIVDIEVSDNYFAYSRVIIEGNPQSQFGMEVKVVWEIMSISTDGFEIIPLTEEAAMLTYLSLTGDNNIILYECTDDETVTAVYKYNIESGIIECIYQGDVFNSITYSNGYVILRNAENCFEIYDMNGNYIIGFSSDLDEGDLYLCNVTCNDILCAWTILKYGTTFQVLVYDYSTDEVVALNAVSSVNSLECENNRVYFTGYSNYGIACYDIEEKSFCKNIYEKTQYELNKSLDGVLYGRFLLKFFCLVE